MKNMCCPITGAYLPRFLPAVLLGFGFIFLSGFILHGQILMSTYEQTPQLWRTPEEMGQYFPFMLLMQFLTAFFVGVLYIKNHEGKGACEGIRFGIMVGLLMGVLHMCAYAWMPISLNLALAWFADGLIKGLGLGLIFSLIYKPSGCCGNQSCGKGECKCAATPPTSGGGCCSTGTEVKKDKGGCCGTGS
ncbi:MAG: hypothetical protein WBK77_05390 [Alphaproteobacteria bacterium]